MFLTHIIRGLFEFALMALMSGLVVWCTYRAFVAINPDFDVEDEIRKGNAAVAILMAAILFAASLIQQRGVASAVTIFRLYITTPTESGFESWHLGLMIVGHLVMSLVFALLTISIALRLFGRLARGIKPGGELQKGNVAMGILLSGVVLVSAMYVSEGVGALSKALIPQPSIGRVHIMK